ncbi:regulator of G-protein signaling 5 [Callorhinchus milii]|uniref:Regulator of G-protein signaling 5 n=1 Tax=Callorhinchus milii TaxID=7868 RepID=V9KY57_CALMI|nr:regulator of G-protein signaling 5 [Callorhinchus milii]|eukprot:gi/632956222/ref/XP_007893852.1/ PREDICTED: regulator of G-protein signaling 5-like [Callorhinchus milii]
MCRGLSSLPSNCLERAKGIKTRLVIFLQSKRDFTRIKKSENPKSRPSSDEARKWRESLDKMLAHPYGLAAFRAFLRSEYSEENLDFWLACEDYKKTKSPVKRASKAKKIYSEFIETDAPKEINIDFETKDFTKKKLLDHNSCTYDVAQSKIYNLMEKDSYPRFLKSELYLNLTKQAESRIKQHSNSDRRSQT